MNRAHQHGISLIISMIMLVLITVVVLMVYGLTTTNAKIIENDQIKTELYSATNSALDKAISDTDFVTATTASPKQYNIDFFEPAQGEASARKTVTVNIEAGCLKGRVLPNAEAAKTVALECVWQPDEGGVYKEGSSPGGSLSLCARVLWDLKATVSDTASGASAESHEGVELPTSRTSTMASGCGV